MKIINLLMFFTCCMCHVIAQDTLRLTIEQAEKLFFENNLLLLAEQKNIALADAAMVQAKLWNNPTISVGDLNFWEPHGAEKLDISQALFAEKIAFTVELEQIIRTAGKRRKRIDLEKSSKEIAIQEFEVLLLSLKTELKTVLHEIIYLQAFSEMIQKQITAVCDLVAVYKKQSAVGNVAKGEVIRLQASSVELETEANEVRTELIRRYKELKVLLNISPITVIAIELSNTALKNPEAISPAALLEMAKNARPELVLSDLNVVYSEKNLIFEKSQRVPDLGVRFNYDRYGGVWKNFIGVGISFDIPVFNRNQGQIKMAKFNLEKVIYDREHQRNRINQEIMANYASYEMNYRFYEKIVDNDFSADMEHLFDVYSRNLMNKNINMLEYIDFMNAYKSSKQAILIAKRNLDTSFAELEFSVNTIIN